MSPEIKEAMLKYEELQLEIRALEDKLDPLKEIIFPFMQSNPKDKLPTPNGGNFEYRERVTWKYSPETERQRAALKQAEKDEVARGTATKSVTSYFQYNSPVVENKELLG